MANKIPLIINAGTGQIQELAMSLRACVLTGKDNCCCPTHQHQQIQNVPGKFMLSSGSMTNYTPGTPPIGNACTTMPEQDLGPN
jgi:hypothetical protein